LEKEFPMAAHGKKDPLTSSTGRRRARAWFGGVALVVVATAITACGGGAPEAPAESAPAPAATPADEADSPLPPSQLETDLPEGVRGLLTAPFTGDFNEMVKRRLIRLAVTYNRSFYFVDKGVQRGAAYEYGKLFEDELNKKLGTGNLKIHVVFVPLPRTMMLEALTTGRVDAVIAQITVTPDKQALVDFTSPTRTDVSEVVVTGPGAPAIASVEDLAGQDVFVREGSTYHQSLLALNE